MSVHPTAIIAPGAEIASDVEVGPYCIIDDHVRIESGCELLHNVYVTGWTRIGAECVLHPGAVVGHVPQDVHYQGDRSYCRIGSHTTLREYVTIHRGTGTDTETVVGSHCFLLVGAHVGHNCVVGSHVTLVNGVKLAGHTQVGDHATFGGNAIVHQFVRIGERSMIGGGAPVSMDIPPFMMTDHDGRIVGLNTVGLRRAGVDGETTAELRGAFQTLYRRPGRFREVIEELAQRVRTSHGRRLVTFLQADSRRGIAGPARGHRHAASPDPTGR